MPNSEDRKGFFITDNLFLFTFLQFFKIFKNRRKQK